MAGSRKSKFTRTGVRRAGDDYQDVVALDLLVEWLEHPTRPPGHAAKGIERPQPRATIALSCSAIQVGSWPRTLESSPTVSDDSLLLS